MVAFIEPDGSIVHQQRSSNTNEENTRRDNAPTNESHEPGSDGPLISNLSDDTTEQDDESRDNANRNDPAVHRTPPSLNRPPVSRITQSAGPAQSSRAPFDKLRAFFARAVTETTAAILQADGSLAFLAADCDGTPRPPTPPVSRFLCDDDPGDTLIGSPARRVGFSETLPRRAADGVATTSAPNCGPYRSPCVDAYLANRVAYSRVMNLTAWIGPMCRQTGLGVDAAILRRVLGQLAFTMGPGPTAEFTAGTWSAMAAVLCLVLADSAVHETAGIVVGPHERSELLAMAGISSRQYGLLLDLFQPG
ncbi:hypothetical protein J8273_5958 [Carpediemonas membranifera]|uniref:Uncharacterized protein n=1 Tax=Carpediemonas membranifera TaxID=201153 RepID=A0A8J6AVL7_9EUKA|nr:hypothetical protein J8273_5958 [Carpediemonas membranifera]|eukprot:KAG9392700.1 hypothetical protein J8273_5958 [Carpediemonas membranifera]